MRGQATAAWANPRPLQQWMNLVMQCAHRSSIREWREVNSSRRQSDTRSATEAAMSSMTIRSSLVPGFSTDA